MNDFDVIVVGAGPSGLLAAGRAAELGARVLVLEKMREQTEKVMQFLCDFHGLDYDKMTGGKP